MGLEKRKNSRWWYGRWVVNGQRFCQNLNVRIRGKEGSPGYEKSRARAMVELERRIDAARDLRSSEELIQAIHRVRTGSSIDHILLEDLPDRWRDIPRSKPPSKVYASQCRTKLQRFVEHIRDNYRYVITLDQVTPAIARSFLDAEEARGITAKTWNDLLKLLRATFKHLRREAGLAENPFEGIPTRETATVNRKPFSPDELSRILDAASADEFIRPVIVIGMCTAMRLGDCCTLKWDDVDLESQFITVKTSKTGRTVQIPIFPLLFQELMNLWGVTSGYVLPKQARTYRHCSSTISKRVKAVLGRAGFRKDMASAYPLAGKDLCPGILSDEEVELLLDKIRSFPHSAMTERKRVRMQKVCKLYAKGLHIEQVMQKTGLAKGTISGLLNEIEDRTGVWIIRGKKRTPSRDSFVAPSAEEREKGLRAASIRDFHSFRVTWITRALSAGVPMEIVRSVTGHATVETVLRHYFNPQREIFRNTLNMAMPGVIMRKAVEESPEAQPDTVQAIENLLKKSSDPKVVQQADALLAMVRKRVG